MVRNFTCCIGGLRCESLHFVGNDRETLAHFAGARGLYGCVERKQIGLVRDIVDKTDNVANSGGSAVETTNDAIGFFGMFHGARRDIRRVADFACCLLRRGGEFAGRLGSSLDVCRCLFGCRCHGGCAFARILGTLVHRFSQFDHRG